MPEVILCIATQMLFVLRAQETRRPAQRRFTAVTITPITRCRAYVAKTVQSRLMRVDQAIGEAAMDPGSRPWQGPRKISLPVIGLVILSGWLVAFPFSLDDVVIARLTTGSGDITWTLLLWSRVGPGIAPDISALATIAVAVAGVGGGLAGLGLNRAGQRRLRDTRMADRAHD